MTPNYTQIIQSLQDELSLTEEAVKLSANSRQNLLYLPITLWKYDLFNLDQVDQIYEGLTAAYVNPSVSIS